jgi:hypothetical protein
MASAGKNSRGLVNLPARARLAEFAGAEFDADMISRAERAVAEVLARYPTLLSDEIGRLVADWNAAPEELNRETVAPVFDVAHELAGYGKTFGYPLVTVFSRSLCRLLTMGDLKRRHMSSVVDAHVTALHVIVRDRMQGDGGSVGLQLAAGLDLAIGKFHLAAGGERQDRLRDEVAALRAEK